MLKRSQPSTAFSAARNAAKSAHVSSGFPVNPCTKTTAAFLRWLRCSMSPVVGGIFAEVAAFKTKALEERDRSKRSAGFLDLAPRASPLSVLRFGFQDRDPRRHPSTASDEASRLN